MGDLEAKGNLGAKGLRARYPRIPRRRASREGASWRRCYRKKGYRKERALRKWVHRKCKRKRMEMGSREGCAAGRRVPPGSPVS